MPGSARGSRRSWGLITRWEDKDAENAEGAENAEIYLTRLLGGHCSAVSAVSAFHRSARALSIFQSGPLRRSVKFQMRGSVRGSCDPTLAT